MPDSVDRAHTVDASGREPIIRPFRPDQALRPGWFDPLALVIVGLIRGTFPLLFVVGMIYMWLSFGPKLDTVPSLTSPMQAFRALLSPFGVLAVAFLLRLTTGIAALVLAYPLSRHTTGSVIGPDIFKRPFRIWNDRLHLVRAYRSLRWSSPVSRLAIRRLGRTGYILSWAGTIVTIAFWCAIPAFLVVVALNPKT